MSWVLWLGVVGVAVVVVDRLGVWAESKGWVYWRKSGTVTMGHAVGGPLAEAFNPGHQHVVTEQERQRLDIRQAGRDEPGRRRETDLSTRVDTRPCAPTPPSAG